MAEYFEVGVRYNRTNEKGIQVKVTEQYLVDAMSFTEAETRITAEVAQYSTSGDFKVMTIKRSQISEIAIDKFGLASEVAAEAKKITGENEHANSDVDRFYKVKVNWINIDEKTLKEKRTPQYFLVAAGSLDAAHYVIRQYLHGTVNDYDVATVDESKIVDVIIPAPKDNGKDA
ncbi:MAG: DUF4494 domain-containing protein [Prevotella stercorea]|nr:DUF4494 domain-containing protein [Leyella stercorea]